MTTVANHNLGGSGGSGAGGRAGRGRGKGAGRRVWQVPLLLAGLGLFGFGVRSLVRAIKPVPFETQVKDIRAMVASGKYVVAINQINAIGNYYKDRGQQAELQWLAGDALYLAQSKQGGTADYTRAADHYRKAQTLGAVPTTLMQERWGLAALKTGDTKLGIEKLELAAKNDPAKWIEHAREFVAAYVAQGDIAKAQAAIDRVLASHDPSVGVDDREWGYAKKIELALMERRAGKSDADLDAALSAARQAVIGMPERDPSGRLLVWIGRAEFEQAKLDLARQHLEEARKKFFVHHLDDGRAAVLLGQIALAQNRLADAQKLFQEAVMGQAGTPVWAAARLGRAQVLAKQDQPDAPMDEDYRFVIKTLQDEAAAAGQKGNDTAPSELVNIDQVRADLTAEYQHYEEQDKQADALKFLALLKEIKDKETPAMALAWAVTRERRAQQLLAADPAHPHQPAAGSREEAQKLLKASAEDYLRHSQMTTMNDAVSGDSLWKAAQLFDQAGETMRSIELFERFTRERPSDPRVPEALLATGRLYQSAGLIDQAIPVYQRNIKENPTTPAAYTSAVNLARCYMNSTAGTADERFKQAEKTLLSLVQDNVNLLPTANEYRVSLFTLGELYYRNDMWADAILRLQEAIARYPDDKGIARATFMLAESFRHSAMDIGEALKTELAGEHRDALIDARQRRLEQAGELFGKVIAMLDVDPESPATANAPPLSALEDETLHASYMDRAECSYLLKDYAGAIKFYDAAATRFSQDATSAEAYVQIVNAYQALGAPAQASAAAERGRWALRQIPDAAFGKGPVPLSRQYYEDLLKLAREN